MPLPEPSEQEGESVKAGQEPSVGARKPQESSSLVLARGKGGPKPRGGKSRKKSGSGKSRKKSGSGRSLKKPSSGKSLEKSGSGKSLENSGSGKSLENSGSVTSLEKSGSGTSLEKSGSGTSLEKSGSGTSLEKSGSGTSLEKSGSGTSLEKSGSGTSLEKPGSGTSLENSGSGTSLEKSGSGTSLEKPGPAALPSNTVQTSTAKKQGRIIHRKRSRVDAADPQPLQFLKTPYGGRLLVHKSFLYKQEKAVGDKVYWKCRLHSDRGCRGRAITRGFRVTVMRDHCHPPDKGSLGGRRRKEKVPASDLPEGTKGQEDGVSLWLYPEEPEPTPQQSTEPPEEDQGYRSLALQSLPPKKRPTPGVVRYQPLEFLKTCYGGTFLVHQSFLYKREKTVGSKVYWTCREHAVHGCRSRAITQGQRVTVMRSHCHSPDMEGLRARRQQEKTIKKIQARRIGAGDLEDCDDIEDSLLQGVDSLFYRRGQGTLTLSRSRSRKQAMEQQESLQESPEEEDQDVDPRGPEFLRTPLGGSFLVYESFLYRREKAAGEKVYWTCRDQARMGCRSRAITQGRQVTVMRGHCHPPDLLGLETLRQREKRPGHAQWDGPEGPEFLKTPLGGSFLVYESFLYRREKATGDKVYWTCRDQARMGCRSRAITQGQRVMVMRRHCHPPDMGGLEALRQRENFPNLTHWEGPEPVQPLEFLRTSLGGRFLVYESFLYRKEKAAGEKVYWMCRDQARLGCRSRAITQGRRVMVMRSHCHPPDLAGLEALRQREKGPSAAKKKKKKKKKGKSKS